MSSALNYSHMSWAKSITSLSVGILRTHNKWKHAQNISKPTLWETDQSSGQGWLWPPSNTSFLDRSALGVGPLPLTCVCCVSGSGTMTWRSSAIPGCSLSRSPANPGLRQVHRGARLVGRLRSLFLLLGAMTGLTHRVNCDLIKSSMAIWSWNVMDHGPHRTDMGLVSFPLDCLLIAFGASFGAHTLALACGSSTQMSNRGSWMFCGTIGMIVQRLWFSVDWNDPSCNVLRHFGPEVGRCSSWFFLRLWTPTWNVRLLSIRP